MKKTLPGLLFALGTLLAAMPASAELTPKRTELDNGVVLLTSEQRALPMISIELLIDAGARYDGGGQEGRANLAARLLTYGTKRRSALQISDALDFIGASLSTGCSENLASVSMTILKKDLSTGLALLAEVLTQSTFPQEEIERQKQSIVASLKARDEEPGDIAERRFSAALFPNSPYGRPVAGMESSVRAISQKGLREFYERYYRPNRTIMAVVGDVTAEEIDEALNQAFSSWKKGEPGGKPLVPSATGAPTSIRVDKELTQANIIMGHEGVTRGNPDYYAIQVMNNILGGGGFSSRVVDSIRNERGLAYSVYTYFNADKSHGTFQFVMQTKNDSAREAMRIAREEIERIRREPVSEQELNDAKDYLTGSFPLRLDTNRKVANFLAQVEFFQLGLDYPDRYGDFIRKVTRQDVLRVAKRYLQPEKLITVVVGNHNKIGE
ncbi:MAG TPA: pitrilysin family protein [Candidatus Binatia bacterium]